MTAADRSYLIDNSKRARQLLTATYFGIMLVTFIFVSPSFAFPPSQPRRRSMTFVDRLIRANPFRALPKVGMQLPFDFYYPVYHTPSHKPPHDMRNSLNYFKNPLQQASRPPIYYAAPPLAVITPVQPQQQPLYYQQLHARVPKYYRGGFTYPTPVPPFNSQQKHPRGEGPFSSYYQSALLSQSYSRHAAPPPPQQPSSVAPTRSAKVLNVDLAPLLHNYVNSSGIKITTPTIGSPMDSQSNQDFHTTGNSNLVRVLVIRPADLERMRNSSGKMDITPQDFMKGYTIKYLAADGKQMVITTQNLVQPQESDGTKTNEQNVTCIEPFCDPFLRQLIPELMTSSSSTEGDEPIVIIKNSNATRSAVNKNVRQKAQVGYFDVVNSLDLSGEEDETLDAEQSQLKPKVHFPTKHLSAKINHNVTSSRKFYYNPPKIRVH